MANVVRNPKAYYELNKKNALIIVNSDIAIPLDSLMWHCSWPRSTIKFYRVFPILTPTISVVC